MRFKLLLALAGAALGTPVASAQHCCGGVGVGPRCSNSANGACGGILGLKQYPFSEERYIRQFCGPHVAAGSCFGYFKPQITAWGDACPMYGDSRIDAATSGLYRHNTPSNPAPAQAPAPKLQPETPPAQPVPQVTVPDVPMPMPETPDAGIPPKPPSAPIIPKL